MSIKASYIILLFSLFIYSCNNTNEEKPSKKLSETNIVSYNPTASYIKEAKSIAIKTRDLLGGNLLAAIKSQGTEHAISFCSTKAIILTDSMGNALQAKVKRVSDKARNPHNKANTAELNYIETIKAQIAQGSKPKPRVSISENSHTIYLPIILNNSCLQCHGQLDKDIANNTAAKIKEIYPNDEATGYKANELRGIWVIEME